MMIVFIKVVGNTTADINAKNPAPTLASKTNRPIDRKMIPLTKVPIAVSTALLIFIFTKFLTSKNNPKNMNAAAGFSIMLAISPPGNVVVSAAINPERIESNKTYWNLGKSIIPKNIIANNKSGVTPKIGGAKTCRTAPIPTNNDKMTKTLVFICKLSSSQLIFPTVHSLSVAEIHNHYNKLFHKLKAGDYYVRKLNLFFR